MLWKLPSFQKTKESFTFFDRLWRQQSNSQVVNWWMSIWTNLAANQNGLGSLLNEREKTNWQQQWQQQQQQQQRIRPHASTSKDRTKESVFLTSSKTSTPVHPIWSYQLHSLLRILLSPALTFPLNSRQALWVSQGHHKRTRAKMPNPSLLLSYLFL